MKSGVFIFSIAALLLFSCSSQVIPTVSLNVNRAEQVDYSHASNWASLPGINDLADSVPLPLRQEYKGKMNADVFFIHPTTFSNKSLLTLDSGGNIASSPLWNASLADRVINEKTDDSPILFQASIFNAAGRVYAPRYRQANYYAYFTSDTSSAHKAFDFAYNDVKQAFEYYLAHYNQGRPIIIASHSQGATHAKRLLKEFFENKPLMNQLVVAYIVGMPVKKNYFITIPVCSSPQQTGCFCSWRTLREGYLTEFIQKETQPVYVTNPLSWDTTGEAVNKRNNKGAVLLNFNKIIKNTTGGRVYGNVLWVNKPKFFGSFLLKSKNYHIGDLNLFYMNVRENAVTRVQNFMQKQARILNTTGSQ